MKPGSLVPVLVVLVVVFGSFCGVSRVARADAGPCEGTDPVLGSPATAPDIGSVLELDFGGSPERITTDPLRAFRLASGQGVNVRIVARRGNSTSVLACEPISAGTVYTLPDAQLERREEGDRITFELWGPEPARPPTAWVAARRARREEVLRAGPIRAFAAQARRQLTRDLLGPVRSWLLRPSDEGRARAENALRESVGAIECALVAWQCGTAVATRCELPGVWDEAAGEEQENEPDTSVLPPRLPAIQDTMCAEIERSQRLVSALLRHAGDVDTSWRDWNELTSDVDGASGSAEDGCREVARATWLEAAPGRLRLLSTIDLVHAPERATRTFAYAGVIDEWSIDQGQSVVVAVRGIPSTGLTRIDATDGASLERPIEDSIRAAVALIVAAVPAPAAIPGIRVRVPMMQESIAPSLEQRTREHTQELNRLRALLAPWAITCPDGRVTMSPPEVRPMASATTRSVLVRGDRAREERLTVCAGERCIRDGAERNVQSEITVRPWPTSSVVLGVGLGVDMRSVRFDDDAQPRARGFQPVGGTAGPDQLYELTTTGPMLVAGVSIVLGFRVQDLLLGFGTTLAADGAAPFQHWHLDVGGRVPSVARDVYLAGRIGLLWEEQPDLVLGERVAVPVPDSGPTPLPIVASQTEFILTVGLAIVVDIAILGKAVDAIADAVEGD